MQGDLNGDQVARRARQLGKVSVGSLRCGLAGPKRYLAYVLATQASYCTSDLPATLDVEMSFVVPGNDSNASPVALRARCHVRFPR